MLGLQTIKSQTNRFSPFIINTLNTQVGKRALVADKRAFSNIRQGQNVNDISTFKRQKLTLKLFNSTPFQQVRFNAITSNTDGTIIPEDVVKLSEEQYHQLANEVFEIMLDELDAFFEEKKIMEAEVDEEAGVMEINCSEGTYIINKQPPTKQIWLSSPISGPKRFDYHNNSWICLRDNIKLCDVLESEMNQMYGDFKWSTSF